MLTACPAPLSGREKWGYVASVDYPYIFLIDVLYGVLIAFVAFEFCDQLFKRRRPDKAATDTRKRTRLKIHLSTAILLMFVAGGLVWLNTLCLWRDHCEVPLRSGLTIIETQGSGVPAFFRLETSVNGHPEPNRGIYWSHLLADVLAGVAVLIAVAVLAERRILRREAPKP